MGNISGVAEVLLKAMQLLAKIQQIKQEVEMAKQLQNQKKMQQILQNQLNDPKYRGAFYDSMEKQLKTNDPITAKYNKAMLKAFKSKL